MIEFLLNNWVLVLGALTSGLLLLWPNLRAGGGTHSVPVAEAVRLINREKGVMVDVSDAAEFAAGHAVGSRHIPLQSLESSIGAGGSSSALPAGLPTNKSLPVLVMCQRGVKAAKAAGLLRKAGYENAHAVAGGLIAWREAQMPTEK